MSGVSFSIIRMESWEKENLAESEERAARPQAASGQALGLAAASEACPGCCLGAWPRG